jgi:hypothetical protein
MTNRFTTLTAGMAFCLALPAPALAEMAPIGTIGHWKLKADAELCHAAGPYENGTSLEFAINSHGAALISIKNSKWRIPASSSYEVVAQIDQSVTKTFKAEASDTWVMWQIPFTKESINLLSYGQTLYVKVGEQEYQYTLFRSEAMLKALISCAGPRMAAVNRFGGTVSQADAAPSTNPFSETASNP